MPGLPINTLLCGDALTLLKTLPDNAVQCCITSPPYYLLRSYLPDNHPDKPLEIGLEETPAAYVARLVEVFHEVKRVLRPDGTLWLNIGDTFANDTKYGGHPSGKHQAKLHDMIRPRRYTGLPAKSLIGIPWRLAFALQEDGWLLRSDVIWAKANPLPESVTDRPSRAHEYLFLFVKQPHYYYDADAIREPLAPRTATTYGSRHHSQGNDALGKVKSDNWGRTVAVRRPKLSEDGDIAGANKRSVWWIGSEPFAGFHYAVMPTRLVEPCVLAGSSPFACGSCNAPWQRVTKRDPMKTRPGPKAGSYGSRTTDGISGTLLTPARSTTIGWQPTCMCPDTTGIGQSVILDPFCGVGTVALMAARHGRAYLGIDLNADYLTLARQRLSTLQPQIETGE